MQLGELMRQRKICTLIEVSDIIHIFILRVEDK